MPFTSFDTAAAARAVAEIADQPDDLAEAFFERREELEWRPDAVAVGWRARREEGLAVRLVRGGKVWLASRDGISGHLLIEAVRQVARAQPRAVLAEPALESGPWGEAMAEDMPPFSGLLERALRAQYVAFPMLLTLRRHRRWTLVVGPKLVGPAQSEAFYSLLAEMPWGRQGRFCERLDEETASRFAATLVERFRARSAPAPESGRVALALGPQAAATLVHEAVAHALEADVLARGDATPTDRAWGPEFLDVLDDPQSAPEGARRQTDDEGQPVLRRWLLRAGKPAQPLADMLWARTSATLLPGAARRGDRHSAPAPRSTHLEVVAGKHSREELLALCDGGLWAPFASRGSLDPRTGRFALELPIGRRIQAGVPGEPVGPFRIEGTIPELLGAVVAVGGDVDSESGAGWCAKAGQRVPVWASNPSLALAAVEVRGS
jgi:predicted Zn-dependent protease